MKKLFKGLLVVALVVGIVAIIIIFDLIPKKKYRVKFVNNKEVYYDKLVVKGTKILEEDVKAEIEGYNIEGWYTNLNDEDTLWNFSTDTVEKDLLFRPKLKLRDDSTLIQNLTMNEGTTILAWDEIKDAKYSLQYNGKTLVLDSPQINLDSIKDDLTDTTKFTIKAIKDDFTNLVSSFEIRYAKAQELDLLFLDFEGDSEVKTGYDAAELTFNSYRFLLDGSLLLNHKDDLSNGERSVRFRDKGSMDFLMPVENFNRMTFDLGSYKHATEKFSTLDVLYKFDIKDPLEEWKVIKTITSTNKLVTHEVLKSEIPNFPLNSDIYFKFLKDSVKSSNINIDDLYITEFSKDTYTLILAKEEDDSYEELEGVNGKELFDELSYKVSTDINGIKYSQIKEILEFADKDLTDRTKVLGIYNNELYRANWGSKSQWHREHVWPNSKLGMDRVKESDINQGSDPHNLRAIHPGTNSSRSNRYYVNTTDPLNNLGHTEEKDQYYPGDSNLGDVARILFYMVLRYDFLTLTDSHELLTKGNYTKDTAYMGKLSILYDWHTNDPVDAFERQRNDVIDSYQGNRNPFIDEPRFFKPIFDYLMIENDKKMRSLDTSVDFTILITELNRQTAYYSQKTN